MPKANPQQKAEATRAKLVARCNNICSSSRMPNIKAISEMLTYYGIDHHFIMGHRIKIKGTHPNGHTYSIIDIDAKATYYSHNGYHNAKNILELLPS